MVLWRLIDAEKFRSLIVWSKNKKQKIKSEGIKMENYPVNPETNPMGQGEQGQVEQMQAEQVQVEQGPAPAEMPRQDAAELGVAGMMAAEMSTVETPAAEVPASDGPVVPMPEVKAVNMDVAVAAGASTMEGAAVETAQSAEQGAAQAAEQLVGAEQPATTSEGAATVETAAEEVSDKAVLRHLCDEFANDSVRLRDKPGELAESRAAYDFFTNIEGIMRQMEQNGQEAVPAETVMTILEVSDRQKAETSQDKGEKERLTQQADEAQKYAKIYSEEKKKYGQRKAEDAQIAQRVEERQAEAAAAPENPNALSTNEIV